MSRRPIWAAVVAVLTFAGWGCSSDMTMVAVRPPLDYEVLGRAEGSSSGAMIIGTTATNFIPIGLNPRTMSAYQDALDSVPGATGLINVNVHETWYWWLLGSTKTVHVSGDAVREVSGAGGP